MSLIRPGERSQRGVWRTRAGRIVDAAKSVAGIGRSADPFGALRVVEYDPIFSSQPLSVSVINDRDFTSGTAAITVENGEYKLTNPGGETCRLESAQRGRYQAGLIGQPGMGLRRTTAPSGTTVYRWGYFDASDGFGFKEDTDGLHTFVRQSSTETYSKPRSDWLDPLDGTGPSGKSLNILDGHVFRMPFAWYGYGSIEFGIVITDTPTNQDEIVVVDRWSPDEAASFHNPNLPLTAEISGDSAGELYVGGRQYGVNGRLNTRRRIMGELRTAQSIADTDGFVPVVSGRLRQTAPWNRVPLQVEGFSLISDADIDWIIVLGADLTSGGTALTDSDWSKSQFTQGDTSTEFNINADAYTGGEIVAGPGFLKGGSGVNKGADSRDIPSQDVPVGEPVTLAARSASGTATVRSSLRIAELR